jgi:rod shape-determining protein MreD
MNELSQTRLWMMRLAFALLVMVNLFFHLLPLDTAPQRWAGPDLVLGFACAWSLRRPEYVPVWSLAILFLLCDLLLQRPPGLWALLALIGCENLKSRGRSLRDASFPVEWVTVSIIIVAITALNRIVMAVVLVPMPTLSLSLFEMGMTLLFYPLIVLLTHALMGVRKAAPGDLDAMGHRV